MLTFTEIAQKAHATAKAKGWHDTARTWGELMALVHSELSEALEAFRECGDVTKTWRREDGKVEGVGAELADAIIRIADAAEAFGLDVSGPPRPLRFGGNFQQGPFGDSIATMHRLVAECWEPNAEGIVTAAYVIHVTAKVRNIPIDDLIIEKMAYNETRPHRHGGKFL